MAGCSVMFAGTAIITNSTTDVWSERVSQSNSVLVWPLISVPTAADMVQARNAALGKVRTACTKARHLILETDSARME